MNGISLFFKDACEEFNIKKQLKGVEQQLDGWDPQRYRVQHDSCVLDQITGKPLPLLIKTLTKKKFISIIQLCNLSTFFQLYSVYTYESSVSTALSALHSKTVFPMTLKRRQKLQSAQSRFESTISLPNTQQKYVLRTFC